MPFFFFARNVEKTGVVVCGAESETREQLLSSRARSVVVLSQCGVALSQIELMRGLFSRNGIKFGERGELGRVRAGMGMVARSSF